MRYNYWQQKWPRRYFHCPTAVHKLQGAAYYHRCTEDLVNVPEIKDTVLESMYIL